MHASTCVGDRTHMKILLFGTGDYYNRCKKWFENQEVLALLDNSEQKQIKPHPTLIFLFKCSIKWALGTVNK